MWVFTVSHFNDLFKLIDKFSGKVDEIISLSSNQSEMALSYSLVNLNAFAARYFLCEY